MLLDPDDTTAGAVILWLRWYLKKIFNGYNYYNKFSQRLLCIYLRLFAEVSSKIPSRGFQDWLPELFPKFLTVSSRIFESCSWTSDSPRMAAEVFHWVFTGTFLRISSKDFPAILSRDTSRVLLRIFSETSPKVLPEISSNWFSWVSFEIVHVISAIVSPIMSVKGFQSSSPVETLDDSLKFSRCPIFLWISSGVPLVISPIVLEVLCEILPGFLPIFFSEFLTKNFVGYHMR